MAYSPGVVNQALKAAQARRASPLVTKALLEAGIVESGLQNLNYGDRDSIGFLQQRPSQGWTHAMQPYLAAIDFLKHAQTLTHSGFQGTAGELAQAVQRSQFPARYDAVGGQAQQLLKGDRSFGPPAGGGMSGSVTPGQVHGGGFNAGPGGGSQLAGLLGQLQQPQPVQTMMPAAPATSANRYLRTAQGYGGGFGSVSTAGQPRADVSSVLQALASQPGQGIPSASVGGARTSVTGVTGPGGKTGTGPVRGGIAKFAGTPVAGWIAPILAYARQHGWQGTVTSGYRSYAQQKSIYDRGVRPAAKPGTSNHEFTAYPGGAVDVSDAQALARILANSPYRGKLVWAGGKDPVHFSHPHNGGY